MLKKTKIPRGRRLGPEADAKALKKKRVTKSEPRNTNFRNQKTEKRRSSLNPIRSCANIYTATDKNEQNREKSGVNSAYQGELKQTGMKWDKRIKRCRKLKKGKGGKREEKRIKNEMKRTQAKEVIHGKREGEIRNYVWGIRKGHRTLNVASINPDSLNNETQKDIIAEMNRRQIHIAGIQETLITKTLT